MILKKNTFGLFLLCFCLFAYAGDMGSKSNNDYFVSLSGGPDWTNAGSSQTIALEPDVSKIWVPQNLTNSNILGNVEIFTGIQKSFFEQIQSQFGLAVYWSGVAKLNGFIQEDGDSGFENTSYQYKINHWHVALKTKWIAENSINMNPYLSGSIGVGFNHSFDYSVTPRILQEVPIPPFQSKTRTAFSYSLGAGFQHTVNSHITIALGYQLVSFGASALDRAEGQTFGRGLSLSNLYTQGIEFNVSYFL
jgi:opacity protein-like surface antigen